VLPSELVKLGTGIAPDSIPPSETDGAMMAMTFGHLFDLFMARGLEGK
jgi:hypothetical protein